MRVRAERGNPVVSPRVRWLLAVFAVLLALASAHRLWWAAPPGDVHELRGRSMGTSWSVRLAAAELGRGRRARAQQAILAQLDRVDSRMSTYRTDSEVSRFNRHASGVPFPVSRDTLTVVQLAREVSELSSGAFDITVGPLIGAWGFGTTHRAPQPPDPLELQALRHRVGYRRLAIDRPASSLSKTVPELQIDLSAIAKGFAVDLVVAELEQLGHRDLLVEVGGEVAVRGSRPQGGEWVVGIQQPDESPGRSPHLRLELRDRALATSGDYRDWYEHAGRRISHTVDPRNGRPVEHTLASVSVVASSAGRADALATALNVLGPTEGYALAEDEGIAAYFIERVPGGAFQTFETSEFARLPRPEPAAAR